MTRCAQINTRQLFCLLFISRIVGTFTFLFNTGTVQPWELPFIALFYGLFSALSAVPILLLIGNGHSFFGERMPSSKAQKAVYFLYGLAFLRAAGLATARLGLFTDTVLLQSIRRTVFLPFLLLCAALCASRKTEAISRAALPILAALLLTLAAILFSLTDEFDTVNLLPPDGFDLSGTVLEGARASSRNWETISLLFLGNQTKGNKRIGFFIWISSVCACIAAVFTVLGGVAGEYGCRQMFPVYLLTVTADFGHMARFDDLLTGIWVLCGLIKTAYLLCVCCICFSGAFGITEQKKENTVLGLSALTVFLLCSFISSDTQRLLKILRSQTIPIIFFIFCIIIPILILIYEKSHKKKGAVS